MTTTQIAPQAALKRSHRSERLNTQADMNDNNSGDSRGIVEQLTGLPAMVIGLFPTRDHPQVVVVPA